MTKQEFKEIFDKHFDGVRNYIYYRSGDTELATDIAQEAFMKIWEKQPDTSGGKIQGLLYKIAGDLFISDYRKQKTALNFKLNIKPGISGENPEDRMQFEELSKRYDRALQELPEKQRVVFLMSRVDDLKYQEISQKLGISVKAVEKRMTLALEHFRSALS